MELNDISGEVVDAAMVVHTALRPGLLEHAYQACLKQAQLYSYLRLGDKPLGLLLNFHVKLMKDGIHRIANNAPD